MSFKRTIFLSLLAFTIFYSCDNKLDLYSPSEKPIALLEGDIDLSNSSSPILKLEAKNSPYLLKGYVKIKKGTTIEIEPGTIIHGSIRKELTEKASALIIQVGAKIIAKGNATHPIIFTSEASHKRLGDWGGLVIMGKAPINGNGIPEDPDLGFYGKDESENTDENDNSGELSYVIVEFAGATYTAEKQLNGFSFYGVGRGTKIDHIQAHMNADDGIEFFGGTIDLKYALSTGNGDDAFDWTEGWQGRGQYWICQQRYGTGEMGIEGNNNDKNSNATPYSNPTLYNITLIGDPSENSLTKSGILLYGGTRAHIYNSIIMDFNEWGLNINFESKQLANNAQDNGIWIASSIFYNVRKDENFSSDNDGFDERNYATAQILNNLEVWDIRPITEPHNWNSPDFRFNTRSRLPNKLNTPTDNWFDTNKDFVGAISKLSSNDWAVGWMRNVKN